MDSCSVDYETPAVSADRSEMTYGFYAPATVPVSVNYARFQGREGVAEFEFVLRPTGHGNIGQQLEWLHRAYGEVLGAFDLAPETAVFRRFFCSDPRNQAPSFEAHPFANPAHGDPPCAVSWVGQPPEPPAKVTLWAQHIQDPRGLETRQEGTSVSLARGQLSHHWTTNVSFTRLHTSLDQTRGIFEEYDKFLGRHGMTLADNVLRTWFFVRHVDVNYKGLVVARRKLFKERGLTPETHFIASTGIEGISALDTAKVAMDAYAVGGMRPEQVEYLEALDHLGPTHVYGVTFERATAVSYRDRKHIFISGTASIDPEGNILHEGDVARQLDRALENVEALLAQAGAGLGDMAAYIAYVRDPSDQALIRQRMRERLGDAPAAVVVAPVCRPGWLIELEGRAIVAAERPGLPGF